MAADEFLSVPHFFGAQRMAELQSWAGSLQYAPEAPGQHWVYHEDSLTKPGRRVIQRILMTANRQADDKSDGGASAKRSALTGVRKLTD